MIPKRGRLKIFLGYAAGVGKTYQMLCEAQRLKREGQDVVIAYFEPHGRKDTIAQTEGIETVPRRLVDHRGAKFEDMDTDAVIARHPQVAVVDEFAHTNVPGSERAKRWEDVSAILDAGIDVLTSLNVQHIESLNDEVWNVTGVRVRETIPDWVVKEASDVVMVDVTPRALQHRLERGVVYPPEKAMRALENFFTEQNLTALRELALRQTAHSLEDRCEPAPGDLRQRSKTAPKSNERILLWLTMNPSTAMLIRRGHRVADYLNSTCDAVFVTKDGTLSELPLDQRSLVESAFNFCRNLKINPQLLAGEKATKAVAAYAKEKGITQIFVARDTPGISNLVNQVRDRQVTIVSPRGRQ